MTNKEFLRWFSGFLDGEGSFSIRFHFCGRHIKVGQYLVINMTSDDTPILTEIKKRLGGYLKHTKETSKWRPQTAWEVSKFSDCMRISKELLKYPLQSRKIDDFNKFYIALTIIKNKRKRGWKARWHKDELIKLAELRDSMWKRKGGVRGYRTAEDIKKFLTIEEI